MCVCGAQYLAVPLVGEGDEVSLPPSSALRHAQHLLCPSVVGGVRVWLEVTGGVVSHRRHQLRNGTVRRERKSE